MSQPYPQHHQSQQYLQSGHLPPAPTGAPAPHTGSPIAKIGAVAGLVGAVAVLVSYVLPWYALDTDSSITVSGLGKVNSPDYEFDTNRLHWFAGAAAVAMIVLVIGQFLGKYDGGWRRGTFAVVAFSLIGALLSFFLVPDLLVRAGGIYLTLTGGLLVAVGAAAMAAAHR